MRFNYKFALEALCRKQAKLTTFWNSRFLLLIDNQTISQKKKVFSFDKLICEVLIFINK